jgi:hypothetical protein
MGAYETIVVLARPDERAGLVAAIFTVGYLAFSIPAVIAGIASAHYGLHETALVYSPVVAVLAATAAGGLLLRRGPTTSDAPTSVHSSQIDPSSNFARRRPGRKGGHFTG